MTPRKHNICFTPVLPVIRDHTSNQGYTFGDEGNHAVRTSTPVSVTYKLRKEKEDIWLRDTSHWSSIQPKKTPGINSTQGRIMTTTSNLSSYEDQIPN